MVSLFKISISTIWRTSWILSLIIFQWEIIFLVACYATLHPALSVRPLVCPSIGLSVRPSHFTFFVFLRFFALLLLPKWSGDCWIQKLLLEPLSGVYIIERLLMLFRPLPLIFLPAMHHIMLKDLWFSSPQSNKIAYYRLFSVELCCRYFTFWYHQKC